MVFKRVFSQASRKWRGGVLFPPHCALPRSCSLLHFLFTPCGIKKELPPFRQSNSSNGISWHGASCSCLLFAKCLIEIGEDVVDVFDTYGETDKLCTDTAGELLLAVELRVGGRRRMDGE